MLYASTLVSMDIPKSTNSISENFTDFAWTPRGTRIITGSETRKSLNIYDDKLKLVASAETTAPVEKITCSAAQRALAVGLRDGTIEFFSFNEESLVPTKSIASPQKQIHELSWIGNSIYLLAYFKDPKPHLPGKDTYYGDSSTLRIFDSKQGSLVKEFSVPNHILKCKVAPSGKHVALIADLHNRRVSALSLNEKNVRQAFQLYSLTDTLEAEPILEEPYIFENGVMALAWSPDSAHIALLFDNGDLKIFDALGNIFRSCSLEECKLVACDIDWSRVNNCLGLPATRDTVQIHAPSQLDEKAVEIIALADYVNKTHPKKPLIADKVAWSPSEAKLAITCFDLGDGAVSSKKYLIVANALARPKKQSKNIYQNRSILTKSAPAGSSKE